MVTDKPGPVIPERYVRALGDADPIESQKKAPKRIKKLLKGLSEKQLARKPAPGKWSIKEVIAHLADGEIILGSRVRFVAAQDNAPLPGYDQDAFVEKLGIERVKTTDLLEAFASVRAANVALLERLPKESFARTGLHSERGPESIETMVAMYAGHDIIHQEQIRTIRAAIGAQKSGKDRPDELDKKSGKKSKEKSDEKSAKKSAKEAKAQAGTGDTETVSSNGKAKKSKDKARKKSKLEVLPVAP